jgi:hypothetical protein
VGYETYKEATIQPHSVRPGEQTLPSKPRAYTDIKSYHAHIYFDEDSFHKAALLHKWAAERFEVELGNWNLEPRAACDAVVLLWFQQCATAGDRAMAAAEQPGADHFDPPQHR